MENILAHQPVVHNSFFLRGSLSSAVSVSMSKLVLPEIDKFD